MIYESTKHMQKFSTHECSEGSATTAEEMRRWL